MEKVVPFRTGYGSGLCAAWYDGSFLFVLFRLSSAQSAVAQGNSLYMFARANTQSGAEGLVSGTVDYDIFGNPVTETGVFAGSSGGSGGISALVFAYAGKPYDPVTGLSDYGFRDYAPSLACEFCEAKSREEKRSFSTFTTVDPIRDGSNWYDIWAASFAKQNLVEKNEVFRPDPVNYVDAWGLDIISFIKDGFIHLATKTAETVTKQQHVPDPVFDAIDEFCEKTADNISSAFNMISVSVTGRAVSPGAGMTLTISKDGVELGGGLGTDLAASATLDLAYRTPITSPAGFSLDLGLSTTIPGTTFGSVGADIVWNENGLYIGGSLGLGVGYKEYHLLVTDGVSQNECEKQRY